MAREGTGKRFEGCQICDRHSEKVGKVDAGPKRATPKAAPRERRMLGVAEGSFGKARRGPKEQARNVAKRLDRVTIREA